MHRLGFDENVASQLRKAQYGVYHHSAVALCHWTRKALTEGIGCYKQTFYGVEAHRCMEFSPAAMYCQNRCEYCWRPIEFYRMLRMDRRWTDRPEEIVATLLRERRKLLVGYMGNPRVDRDRVRQATNPTHFAISLSGEPTIYPYLPELIRFLKGRKETKSVFLVTNGQEPAMLKRLIDEDSLPHQLYLSMNAADESTFIEINKPFYRDSWRRWLESLQLLSQANCRRVIRVTFIRGKNTNQEFVPLFGKLIGLSGADFLEFKSYMHVGRSYTRLTAAEMLAMDEVLSLASRIAKSSGPFEYLDSSPVSLVCVYRNVDSRTDRWLVPQTQKAA